MDIVHWNVPTLFGLVVLMTAVRYLFKRLLAHLLRPAQIRSVGVQTLIKSIIMVGFNLLVLLGFGLLTTGLVAFTHLRTGLVFLAIGLAASILIAVLSYQSFRAGHGEGYGVLLPKTPTESVLTWSTFLIWVGPAENLFFIGFVQHLLGASLGWGAMLVYVVLFTLYHYVNVISGVEKKEEFLGMLPVRLVASALLALSFYATTTLIYGFIIHNLIDTASYLGLVLATRNVEASKSV